MRDSVAYVTIITLIALLLLAISGCVTVPCHDSGTEPWTHERPTVPFHVTVGQGMNNAWFADGGPTVLEVHNPTDQTRDVHVSCFPSVDVKQIDRGHIEGWVVLAPHTETRRLVEFMNIDAISQVCLVSDSRVVRQGPSAPGIWRGATGKVDR